MAQAIKGRRADAFISVKCGAMFSPSWQFMPQERCNVFPATLWDEAIDLYQPCHIDLERPYKDTIPAINRLIK